MKQKTMFHTMPGYRDALRQAVAMDCFTDEFRNSEYTRGVVDLIMWTFTRGPIEETAQRCRIIRDRGDQMTMDRDES